MANKKEKRKPLGRGLESLLGPIITDINNTQASGPQLSNSNFPPDNKLRNAACHLQMNKLRPNPYQPRSSWPENGLEELADSIRANGILQPILVRPVGSGYEIIAGERRFRAAEIAGLQEVPVLVRDATDVEMLELALVENIHRSDLNPIERALAYKNFLQAFSLSQTDAAARLGEDRSVVANHLRLLDLPQIVKQLLIDEKLSMGHARAILALPTDELRTKLANRALAGRLSVRDVERLVRLQLQRPEKPKLNLEKAPYLVDIENQLRQCLGTKVRIETRKNGKRGKIVIDFYSLDEFDSLLEKIGIDQLENA